MDERIDKGVFQWFAHVKRIENYGIAKRVFAEECADSCTVGQAWKRWIDTVKKCLKKKKKVWILGKQGESCMIGENGRSL